MAKGRVKKKVKVVAKKTAPKKKIAVKKATPKKKVAKKAAPKKKGKIQSKEEFCTAILTVSPV